MSTEVAKLPRKKTNLLWWIGGLFLLLVAAFLYLTFGPNPPIVISRETTYLTSPRGADGYPEYGRYALELYRKGVTPENNAATLLWPAMWPGELDPPQYAAVAKELGLDHIPSKQEALVRYDDKPTQARLMAWLREQQPALVKAAEKAAPADPTIEQPADAADANANDALANLVDDLLGNAVSAPWTSKQIPPLAKWVKDNQKPLDQIVLACKRSRCYFPSPTLLNPKPGELIAMLLPGVQTMRGAGRALAMRAMWNLGEGHPDAAWNDLLAVHRLGRLCGQGKHIVEQLVGIAIDGIAFEHTLPLLDDKSLSLTQARQIQRDLAGLGYINGLADSLDSLERLFFIDSIIEIGGRSNSKFPGLGPNEDVFSYLGHLRIDFNTTLRRGNERYDQLVAALRLPNWKDRDQLIRAIENDIGKQSSSGTPGTNVELFINPVRRNEIVADMFSNLFLPAISATTSAQDRAHSQLDLERVAAALAVYRIQHGSYPTKLAELVPGAADSLPNDMYTGKSFVYRRTADGYLLYSVGPNGQDDGGSNEYLNILAGRIIDANNANQSQASSAATPQIPSGADDISIRMPRPVFEMPKPKPADGVGQKE